MSVTIYTERDMTETKPVLLSGEWLLHDQTPESRYKDAFVGTVVSHWSGGTTWKAPRDVVEAVIRMQDALIEGEPSINYDRLFFDGDDLVLQEGLDDLDEGEEPERSIMTRHGDEYQLPSWTWYEVPDATEVDEIHGDWPGA